MTQAPVNVPIARTLLSSEEIESVVSCLRSGWLVQGPRVKDFEKKWSNFVGVEHSIAVTSGTTALHLSLAALGFNPGDEAIVPAFTWVSTANVIEHLGGRVVFCDIKLDTFNLDINQLESLVTSKTKAIIPVHLFGLAANMEAVQAVAKQHGLAIVEDAACGFGTRYHGRHVGTFGDTGCFSFHPRKSITTGEGGMITTNDDQLAAKLYRLRDHGASVTDLQRHMGSRPYLLADHLEAGYNQRMTDIQGALGSAQMERAQDIIAKRQQLAKIYDEAFLDLGWLRKPASIPGYEHSYQSYACLFEPEPITVDNVKSINMQRNSWMDELMQNGVSTRPATHAVHMLSYYRDKYQINPSDYPNSWIANDCSISLPLFHGMTELEQEHVIQMVRNRKR